MNYEVEQKFRVADRTALLATLTAHGITLGEPIVQADCYFNHPARDFGQTDEALRIRSIGERNWVTYKGPKIDATTKTRRELEFPLVDGVAVTEQFAELLVTLGFRSTAVVRKQRRSGHIHFAEREFEVLLDEVDNVGLFAEVETLASPEELPSAKAALTALAAELGLGENERRSYLEMLLERNAATRP